MIKNAESKVFNWKVTINNTVSPLNKLSRQFAVIWREWRMTGWMANIKWTINEAFIQQQIILSEKKKSFSLIVDKTGSSYDALLMTSCNLRDVMQTTRAWRPMASVLWSKQVSWRPIIFLIFLIFLHKIMNEDLSFFSETKQRSKAIQNV